MFAYHSHSYSNSVVQALYFCKPFRQCVLNYPQVNQPQQPLYTPQSTHPNSPMVSTNGHSTSYFTSSSSSSVTGANGPSLNGSINRPTNGTSTPNRESTTVASSTATSTTVAKTMSRGSINGLNGVNGSSGTAMSSSTPVIEKDQNNVNLAPGMEDTLFSSLKDLFWKISTNKKKSGVIAPVNFINKVKKENGNILYMGFTVNK